MRVLLNVNNMPLPKRYTICLTSGNGKKRSSILSVTDAFAADAIFSLATVFKHRNIPDLRPSTPYHILSAFKQSCDTYAGIILNQAVPEELSELTELIVGGLPPEEIRERISALNSKSQYSMADKGVAGTLHDGACSHFLAGSIDQCRTRARST